MAAMLMMLQIRSWLCVIGTSDAGGEIDMGNATDGRPVLWPRNGTHAALPLARGPQCRRHPFQHGVSDVTYAGQAGQCGSHPPCRLTRTAGHGQESRRGVFAGPIPDAGQPRGFFGVTSIIGAWCRPSAIAASCSSVNWSRLTLCSMLA